MKSADTKDLKSFFAQAECGFKSRPGHHLFLLLITAFAAQAQAQAQAQTPAIAPDGVVNSATSAPAIQPGAQATIFGTNLASTTRPWTATDFHINQAPTSLDSVSVLLTGRPAIIEFISPQQINIALPEDIPLGPTLVTVTHGNLISAAATVNITTAAPGLFRLPSASGRYAAATTPALAGQALTLYGTGFGLVRDAPVTATIGPASAPILFAGRVAPGLDQINLLVPALPDGEYPIVLTTRTLPTQADIFVSIGSAGTASVPGIYNPIAKSLNTVVVLGDSISNSSQDYGNEVWPTQTFVRSDGLFLKIGDAGVPSDTTARMLARIGDILVLNPAICVLLGGSNEAAAIDLAPSLANIDAIVKTLQKNNIRPILSLIPPRNGYAAHIQAFNTLVQQYASEHRLPCVDFFKPLADPSTGDYLPRYSADGIHPTPVGAQIMADTFLSATRRLFMPVPSFLPTPARNQGNFLGSGFFTENPTAQGLADGWVVAAGIGLATLLPDPAGFNRQSLTAIDAAGLQIEKPYIAAGPATFSDGDRLVFIARLTLTQPVSGNGSASLALRLIADNQSSTVISPLAGWTTNLPGNTVYHEFTVPPHTSFLNLSAAVLGAGTSLQLSQLGLFNLSKLRSER